MYPVPPHGKGILHSSVWDVTTPPVARQSTLGGAHQTSKNDAEADTQGQAEGRNTGEEQERSTSLPEGVEPGTVDIAIMIFVLSALHPLEWQRAIANVYKVRQVFPLKSLPLPLSRVDIHFFRVGLGRC